MTHLTTQHSPGEGRTGGKRDSQLVRGGKQAESAGEIISKENSKRGDMIPRKACV